MKRSSLLAHLRYYGCILKREGKQHSLWMKAGTGAVEAIPRHREIADRLARKICKKLAVPDPKRQR